MTRDEAMAAFRRLVGLYGLRWSASGPNPPPPSAWDTLAEINRVLDEGGRREALGLPRGR